MPVQKEAVNRFLVLTSCLLMACALDVPGSGPALTDDDVPIHELDPSAPAPASGPGSTSSVSSTGSAAAASPGSVAPALVADAATASEPDAGNASPVPAPSADAGVTPPTSMPAKPGAFALASTAFDDGARLPSAFTCQGADQSPPLHWVNPPPNTKTFALVLTSKSASKPNASATVEWVVWQIPATRSMLPQGVAAGSQPSNVPGARQDASDDGSSSSAGGLTGVGGTIGVGVGVGGVGVGGGVTGNFGGSWGASAGISPATPITTGAPFYPTSGATSPRYHGPCFTSGATYEFTLFALDASASTQWGSYVSIATVTQWIKTQSDVLGHASLSATYP
jgi:phosphatidylethanolamine-binding protein (PEBP) family uncharacterized protein